MSEDEVLEHFTDPRNVGEIEDADGIGSARHPIYGEESTIYIKIDEERILDAKFVGRAGFAGIITGSVITELIKGKTFDEASSIRSEDILYIIGDGFPLAFHHCIDMYIKALHLAIEDTKK